MDNKAYAYQDNKAYAYQDNCIEKDHFCLLNKVCYILVVENINLYCVNMSLSGFDYQMFI